MIVIPIHHDGNPTIITGSRIINGCEDFDVTELETKCVDYAVNSYHCMTAMSAVGVEQAGGGRPLAEFMNHPHCAVRATVAKYATDEQRAQMEATEIHWGVLGELARYGTDALREKMLDGFDAVEAEEEDNEDMAGNWRTREVIAQYGSDKLRTRLLTAVNIHVRSAVAEFGTDEHRALLADDVEADVREYVALHGNDEVRAKLAKDKDSLVRAAAQEERP